MTNANALNLLKAPPHPALSPNAGERVRVRGIGEYVKRLNAFVIVSVTDPLRGTECQKVLAW